MVSKVRGKFTDFSGQFVTGADPLDSTVTATVQLASIDTGNADRDNHIRSADFFDVDAHQVMVLFIAGVQKIPTSLYDAARVDGAGAVREFFAVTLPGLRNESPAMAKTIP